MQAHNSVDLFYNELQSYRCFEVRNQNERDAKLERVVEIEKMIFVDQHIEEQL